MQSSPKTGNQVILLILLTGALLRIALGLVNPPNNTFDDYLQPISFYINQEGRPSPAACWECYQPPIYYYLAEQVYKVGFKLTSSYFLAWKCVQFISVLFSIGTLVLIYKILSQLFASHRNSIALVLAVISIYPRDIYTAAMISNDALLVFEVTLCVWLFLKFQKRRRNTDLILLCVMAVAAAHTKQHGLITLCLPAAIAAQQLFRNQKMIRPALFSFPVLLPLVTGVLSLGDEIWKYHLTGHLLVSNQHFFDYTSVQLPGSLAEIEFLTFRFPALFTYPLMNPATVYSYWTVLFAGAWFDYEWRFISPQLPLIQLMANTFYTFGLLIVGFWLYGALRSFIKKPILSFTAVILLVVASCYFLVPLIQTLRFPYYSSMKSLFFLPALSIMALVLCHSFTGYTWVQKQKLTYVLLMCIICIGILHIGYVIYFLPSALPELSGPLWTFPQILLPL